jgi:hypothetical protein
MYELTTAGAKSLAEQRAGWHTFSGAVSAVLSGGARWVAPA